MKKLVIDCSKPIDHPERERVIEMTQREVDDLCAKDLPIEEIIQSAIDSALRKRWSDKGELALDMVTRGKEAVEAEMAAIRQDTTVKVIAIEEAALESTK